MIKKTLSLLLLICVLFSFSACALFPDGTDGMLWKTGENKDSEQTKKEAKTEESSNSGFSFFSNEEYVTDKEIAVRYVEDGEPLIITGQYTGKLENGKPEGYGKWFIDLENGTSIRYEGEFLNGNFNGQGAVEVIYEGESYKYKGTFTDGEYTPTNGEAYHYIAAMNVFGGFLITEKIIEYIDAHNELFPICEKATAEAADLQNFSYKQFTKTRKQEEIGLIKLKLTAVQVFEDDVLGGKLTYLLAYDADNNIYSLYYRDSVEVYDGDSFVTYAIPCGTSSFDNIGGGVTSTVVLLACYMK